MEPLTPTHHFQNRLHEPWLLGLDGWALLTQQRLQELSTFTQEAHRPRILLNLQEPLEFLATFMAACLTESPIFLGNPNWSQANWKQALELCQPHIIWDQRGQTVTNNPVNLDQRGWIMIPTGGSSGQIRFATHTWTTLMASVKGCQQYFDLPKINSCCTLPLHHVSGLMQFLRSFTTGGKLAILPFNDFLNGISADPALAAFLDRQSQEPREFFLSLVPTQLQRLLQKQESLSWLAQFQTVLLGGAPAWPKLLDTARKNKIRLAPTYGMTETASQVVTLKPDEFLAGFHSNGQVLPHAQVRVLDEDQQALPKNKAGRIVLKSQSLCLGYYPEIFSTSEAFSTDDIGYLGEEVETGDINSYRSPCLAPHLHIIGRCSRKIISGGENIYPEEIEAAIQATELVTDVYVTGMPDAEWGEVAIALYIPRKKSLSVLEIETSLQGTLSKFKYPKQWFAVSELPRNPQGKISPIQIETLLRSLLPDQGR